VRRRPPIGRLRRPWAALGATAVVLAVLAATTSPSTSDLPAWLPVTLVAASSAGTLAAMVAVGRGLARTSPADDDAALAELRARQALRLAIGLAPVLLGVAMAVIFGHRATLLVAAIVAGVIAAVGNPRNNWLQAVDASWNERGLRASIVRAAHATTPERPEHS
jgi:hypothetical protein